MSDIEIVHQHTRGFSETGQVSERSESFIKILTSFRHGSLRHLKGAPLSVFLCVALHEADAMPGCSLTVVCSETGFSRPSVIEGIRFLSNPLHRFIEEAGLESDGTKRYRVTAFAWFGNKPKGTSDLQDAGSKNSLPPSPSKKFLPPHVHDDVLNIKHSENETSSIHERVAIEKILEGAFEGINVQRLAARMDNTEIAQAWVDWCDDDETQKRFRNPQGIAYRALMETENARPTFIHKRADQSATRKPICRGKFARPVVTGKLAHIVNQTHDDIPESEPNDD